MSEQKTKLKEPSLKEASPKNEEKYKTCPRCGLPLRRYAAAGYVWYRCLSPYCSYMEVEK